MTDYMLLAKASRLHVLLHKRIPMALCFEPFINALGQKQQNDELLLKLLG